MGIVTKEQGFAITIVINKKVIFSTKQRSKSQIKPQALLANEQRIKEGRKKEPNPFLNDNPNHRSDRFLSKSGYNRPGRDTELDDKMTRNSSWKEWLSRLRLSTEKRSWVYGVEGRKGVWWECLIPLIAWRQGLETNFSPPLPAQELGTVEWYKQSGSLLKDWGAGISRSPGEAGWALWK